MALIALCQLLHRNPASIGELPQPISSRLSLPLAARSTSILAATVTTRAITQSLPQPKTTATINPAAAALRTFSMKPLQTQFSSREAVTHYLVDQFSDLLPADDRCISSFTGQAPLASTVEARVQPGAYARTRNFYSGSVTRLSPYLRHGLIERRALASLALAAEGEKRSEKFIQELLWGEFWQQVAERHPDWLWHDAEAYKTGYHAEDYAIELPDDIARGQTPNACINHFIRDLTVDGYVHNHARMYLAAYVIHFRRIRWQTGAAWFLQHLLDGDVAANNLSWQWVASTFGSKPYIFNLDNVAKYCGDRVDCLADSNPELDASYETLAARLFQRSTS